MQTTSLIAILIDELKGRGYAVERVMNDSGKPSGSKLCIKHGDFSTPMVVRVHADTLRQVEAYRSQLIEQRSCLT